MTLRSQVDRSVPVITAVGDRIGLRSRDSVGDLVRFVGHFVAFAAVDVATRALANPDPDRARRSSLVLAALVANPVAGVAVVALAGLAIWRSPRRFLGRWTAIERGASLRLFAAPLVLLLVWQQALQPYDFFLDQSHLLDRALLIAVGIGALFRPALLLAFVAQQRIIVAPLAFTFGSVQGQNIDELLVVVLVALVGAQLMAAVTRVDDTAPVVAVVIAAVASAFFVPGRGKLLNGWLSAEDLHVIPINANTAGWLGQTGGGLITTMAGVLDAVGPLARIATLILELGAVVAAVHHRVFRWWLVPAAVFHVINFWLLGYWFIGWVLIEVGLAVLLWRADGDGWLERNLTPARALLTVAVIALAGARLFHPPGLAWFDSPVGQGYEIEAVGASGATYHVPFGALAPFEQDLAFNRLVLGTDGGVAGPYGVVGRAGELDHLRDLTEPAQVTAIRSPLDPTELAARDRAEAFLADWLDRANRRADGDGPALDRLRSLRAPPHFWSGRPEPTYRFQEPIGRLEVVRVTSLTTGDETTRWRTTVLILDVAADGTITVVDR